jgi:UDP-N-acetylenolpyruvoylglucosamine reductase
VRLIELQYPINTTAAAIEELISVLQQRVFDSSGITLEREIIFVGEK